MGTIMVHRRVKKNQKLRGIHKFKTEIRTIKDRSYITEKEINRIRMRMNAGKLTYEDVEVLNNIKITPEQTQKGLNWLINKWKTPKGKERKNNPFGLREQRALKTFKEFRLNSFHNNVNVYQQEMGIKNWIPIWDVVGRDANFQYYMEAGMPKIIG